MAKLIVVVLIFITSSYTWGQAFFKVFDNKKYQYGLYSLDGTKILETDYDTIRVLIGTLLVTKKFKMGVTRLDGTNLIAPSFDYILTDCASKQIMFPVNKNGKWGYYDSAGRRITRIKYDKVSLPKNGTLCNTPHF
jgi:hypothetical protein